MREPLLLEGEQIVLRAQGSFQDDLYGSPWRLGYLYLTNRRLSFIQVTKWLIEVDLTDIRDLGVVKRGWLLGVRVRQLGVSFKSGGGDRTVFIGLKRPEEWVEAIIEGMTLALVDRR